MGGVKVSDTDRVQLPSGDWEVPSKVASVYKASATEYANLVSKTDRTPEETLRMRQLEVASKLYSEAGVKGETKAALTEEEGKALVQELRTKEAMKAEGITTLPKGVMLRPFGEPELETKTATQTFTTLLQPKSIGEDLVGKSTMIERPSPPSEKFSFFKPTITGAMAMGDMSKKDKGELTYDARRIADLNARINFERSKMTYQRDEDKIKSLVMEREKLATSLMNKYPGRGYETLITDAEGPTIGMAITDVNAIESKMTGVSKPLGEYLGIAPYASAQMSVMPKEDRAYILREKDYLARMKSSPEQLRELDKMTGQIKFDLDVYTKRQEEGKVTNIEKATMEARLGPKVDDTYRVEMLEGYRTGARTDYDIKTGKSKLLSETAYRDTGVFEGAKVEFVSPQVVEKIGEGLKVPEPEKKPISFKDIDIEKIKALEKGKLPLMTTTMSVLKASEPFINIGQNVENALKRTLGLFTVKGEVKQEQRLVEGRTRELVNIEEEKINRLDKQMNPLVTTLETTMTKAQEADKVLSETQLSKYGTAGVVKIYDEKIRALESDYAKTKDETTRKLIEGMKTKLENAKILNEQSPTGYGPYYEALTFQENLNKEIDKHNENPSQETYDKIEQDKLTFANMVGRLQTLDTVEDKKIKELDELNEATMTTYKSFEDLNKDREKSVKKIEQAAGKYEQSGYDKKGEPTYKLVVPGESQRLLEDIQSKDVIKMWDIEQAKKASEAKSFLGWTGATAPRVLPLAASLATSTVALGRMIGGRVIEGGKDILRGDSKEGLKNIGLSASLYEYESSPYKPSAVMENINWEATEGALNVALGGGGFLKGLGTTAIGSVTKTALKESAKKVAVPLWKTGLKGLGYGALTGITIGPEVVQTIKGEQNLRQMGSDITVNLMRLGLLAAATKGATQVGVGIKKGIVMNQIDNAIKTQMLNKEFQTKLLGKTTTNDGTEFYGNIRSATRFKKPIYIDTSVGKVKVELLPKKADITVNTAGQPTLTAGGRTYMFEMDTVFQANPSVKITLPDGGVIYKDLGTVDKSLRTIGQFASPEEISFIQGGRAVRKIGDKYEIYKDIGTGTLTVKSPKTSVVDVSGQQLKTKDLVELTRAMGTSKGIRINKEQYRALMSDMYKPYTPETHPSILGTEEKNLITYARQGPGKGGFFSTEKQKILSTEPEALKEGKVIITGTTGYVKLSDGTVYQPPKEILASFRGGGTTTTRGIATGGDISYDLEKGFKVATTTKPGILYTASKSTIPGQGGSFGDWTGGYGWTPTGSTVAPTTKQTIKGITEMVGTGGIGETAIRNVIYGSGADIGGQVARQISMPSAFNIGAYIPSIGLGQISQSVGMPTTQISERSIATQLYGGTNLALSGSLPTVRVPATPIVMPGTIPSSTSRTAAGTVTEVVTTPIDSALPDVIRAGVIGGITMPVLTPPGGFFGGFAWPEIPELGPDTIGKGKRIGKQWVVVNPLRNLWAEFKAKQLATFQPFKYKAPIPQPTTRQIAQERVSTMFGGVKRLTPERAQGATVGGGFSTTQALQRALKGPTFRQPTQQPTMPRASPRMPSMKVPTAPSFKRMMGQSDKSNRQMPKESNRREAAMRSAMSSTSNKESRPNVMRKIMRFKK